MIEYFSMFICVSSLFIDVANGGDMPLPENVEAFEAHLLKTMKDIAENANDMSVSVLCMRAN